MGKIQIKRIYDPKVESDGYRILVDRLWPRGIKKEAAALTDWCKDVAPSHELRKEFGHQMERFEEFREKYLFELHSDPQKSLKADELCQLAAEGTVTLLYAAKNTDQNHAIVLREELLRRIENQ
ncbi:DUF488 domain-containing protein [Bacillus massilinigeriensis]|uniref:DUF488 domain-containing protein n=1 Tax=Bacillus massilionigeriensis TaxID=1805475 RepID=UPI00096B136B|nr:DUF488 domain-containing protein [Bacillus massilionigeriensis]